MLSNIKAVIFDLDGTLVDSMWIWKKIDEEFLGRFQIGLPEDLQRSIEGMGFTETAGYFKKRFLLPMEIEEIKEEWNSMAYEKYTKKVFLKQGAAEFLNYLKQQGIKLGIATSNSKELVEAVMKVLEVRAFFQSVTTACDVKAGKPSPDIYLQVAKELGAEPAECLVFEDIPMGILAGKRANMRVCAIEDEFSADQELEKRRLADYYIRSYYDILKNTYEDLTK